MSGSATPSPAPTPPAADPAANTQAILGARILTGVAVSSFVVTVVLLIFFSFRGDLIRTEVSRFCLIALMSLTLATFTWVLFPHVVNIKELKIPVLNWPVTGLSGPLVLFLLILGVLAYWFPHPKMPATRYYAIEYPGDIPPPLHTFRFNDAPSHPKLHPVLESPGSNKLIGLIAVFDSTDEFRVNLTSSQDGYFEKQEINFEPSSENGPTIKLAFKVK